VSKKVRGRRSFPKGAALGRVRRGDKSEASSRGISCKGKKKA